MSFYWQNGLLINEDKELAWTHDPDEDCCCRSGQVDPGDPPCIHCDNGELPPNIGLNVAGEAFVANRLGNSCCYSIDLPEPQTSNFNNCIPQNQSLEWDGFYGCVNLNLTGTALDFEFSFTLAGANVATYVFSTRPIWEVCVDSICDCDAVSGMYDVRIFFNGVNCTVTLDFG